MKRLALSALLATLALLGAAPPASAHTELLSSDPADGATLPQPPSRLTLTFSEPVPAESATVTVTVPDGTQWKSGEASVSGATLTVPVTPDPAPPGQYVLNWQVVALDGDYVSGSTTFSLTAPATAVQPTPAPQPGTPTTAQDGTSTPPTSEPTAVTISAFASDPPATRSAATDDGGLPVWVWVVGALLLVAVGAAVALRLKGRKSGETPE
ncbi:copper resistance CopC family protein [Actinosynnema sp. CS-041913]|uniref:copper resistance CopC family protein n=1 Tax=Actinosynnema sp. CS-041913 TaxID=3239917 RepID=UPI003D8F2D98